MIADVKFIDRDDVMVADIPKRATALIMNPASKELKFEVAEKKKPKPKRVRVADLVLSDTLEKLLGDFTFVSDLPEDLTQIKGVGEKTASLIKEAMVKFNKE